MLVSERECAMWSLQTFSLCITIPLGIGYYAANHLELFGGTLVARDCTASTTISTASRTIDYLIVLVTARARKVGPAQIRRTDVTRYVLHIIDHAASKRA